MAWLHDNPPARSQYRSPRRDRPRGVIVLHTSESVMDTVGPDTGAENVARFIQRRSDPGSYHDLCDSDSTVHLVDYDDEAYHDGTGSNRWSTSVAWACATTDWARMAPDRRRAFLYQGAKAAAAQARHTHARTGVTIPARRITKAESDRGTPGFIAHGDRDPGRRTDPGVRPDVFPFDEFFDLYTAEMGGTSEEDDMTPDQDKRLKDVETDVDALKRGNEVNLAYLRAIAADLKIRQADIRKHDPQNHR